jgi:hypothetical protein
MTFRSVNVNFVFGVAGTLDAALVLAVPERARSCGQVTVAPWNAIGGELSLRGGTGLTSAELRYFSIRRRETKDCNGNGQTREHDFPKTYLKHVDQCFRECVQCIFHLGEDYQIILNLILLALSPKLTSDLQQANASSTSRLDISKERNRTEVNATEGVNA